MIDLNILYLFSEIQAHGVHHSMQTHQLSHRRCVTYATTVCKCCCVSYGCPEPVWTLVSSFLHLVDAENLCGITRSSSLSQTFELYDHLKPQRNTPTRGSYIIQKALIKEPFQRFWISFYVQNLHCVIKYYTVFLLLSNPDTMNSSKWFVVR